MGDLFIVNMDQGDGNDRSRREEQRRRLRARYLRHLVDTVRIDEHLAERIMAALFDHVHADGRSCVCGCHPRLTTLHDDGFNCPCMWDEARRAKERQTWADWGDTPEAAELREAHALEERSIAAWLAGQPRIEARRTTSCAPEQWEGNVDGRSFYFRERHGVWRLELDLEPTGRHAERLVRVREDGEMVTEPVPMMEGDVIAEGIDSQLGDAPVDHIAFIVKTIRDYLWASRCDHSGALFFCPKCGHRMEGPA